MPTPTATPTVTVTPTPVPILALTSLEPATVLNDQPARITVVGGGFVDTSTYAVSIGGRPLSNVVVESLTHLKGTLPAGLCPGPYTATVEDTTGRHAAGGGITMQAVHTIVQDQTPNALTIKLTGWTQRRSLDFPSVQVEDSGCGTTDWRITFEVDVLRDKGHSKTLIPRVLTVRWSDGGTARVPLSRSGALELGTLVIPRNGATTVVLTPSLDLEVPANAFIGSYTTTLTTSFAN